MGLLRRVPPFSGAWDGRRRSPIHGARSPRTAACLSPTWIGRVGCRGRGAFVGWIAAQRAQCLTLASNDTRFLILPRIMLPHLPSWALGHVLPGVSVNRKQKYGHPILSVESLVAR